MNTDKPLCRPAPPISLVCQTRCNVFLPPKIIPAAYMESPRMGPNLPYKPALPNRTTNLPRTSQSGNTNSRNVAKRAISVHPGAEKRATRIYLRLGKRAFRVQRARLSFPLIIIHVRRYGESSRGPYHPWGRACDRVCVSDCLGRRGAPSWADMQEYRETERTARHTERDRPHAGSF